MFCYKSMPSDTLAPLYTCPPFTANTTVPFPHVEGFVDLFLSLRPIALQRPTITKTRLCGMTAASQILTLPVSSRQFPRFLLLCFLLKTFPHNDICSHFSEKIRGCPGRSIHDPPRSFEFYSISSPPLKGLQLSVRRSS